MSNDIAYANADFIPDAAAYPPRWCAAAAASRAALSSEGRARLDLPYGDAPRQRFDLFLPGLLADENTPAGGSALGPARGVVVFVHGGYWRRFGKESWSHLAAGALARGWAVAMPGYTLAPEARIAEITREIGAAVTRIAAETAGPIVLSGHSAGGHLVARMLCRDAGLPSDVAARIAGCMAISPLSDLRPLIDTAMNADLRLDAAEAAAESPVLLQKVLDIPLTVWVGADERPAFLDQARGLADAWGGVLRVDPGRHHFDVIDGLADADSPLMRALLPGDETRS
ncbi:alpha/beta hydrolase [Oceaniglobus indicus]|uniref:alpha/beta hydrolase n=1 Tax=Oceaniglobus indicus TaxID=2047749 RepID=UPI000C1A06CA|nr:alpha/beta hydrolase [Oceaniglobus indicus]